MWSANNNNRNIWPPNAQSHTANNQDWGSLAQQWANQKTNAQNWQNPAVMNDIRIGHPSLPFNNPKQYTARQFVQQQYFDDNQDIQLSNFLSENYQQEPFNGSQSHNLSLLGPQPGHNNIKNTNINKFENEYPSYTNYEYNNQQKESSRNWNDGEEPPDLYNTNREIYDETYNKSLNYQTSDQELVDSNSSMLQFQTNPYAPNTNSQMHSLEQSNAFNSNFSQQTSFIQPPTINLFENSIQTDSMANFLNLNNPNQFGAQSNMSWTSTLPQANPLMFGIMPPMTGLSNPPIPPQFLAGLPQNFIPNVHHQHKKTLPAWLKEGLEKMEKEKQKKKGSIDNEPSTLDGERPTYPSTDNKNIFEFQKDSSTPKQTLNKMAEQTPPSLKGEASPFPNYESQSENESEGMTPKVPPSRDLITNIKLLLTEVLMDSTSYLINKVAAEQMLIIQNEIKEQNLQKSRKALSKISSLGIAEYGSEGDSSQEEDDDNSLPSTISSPHEQKSSISSLPPPSTATELLRSRSSTPNVSCVMPNVISNNIEISESHSSVGVDASTPDNGTTLKNGDKVRRKETLDASPTQDIPLPLMPALQAKSNNNRKEKVGREAVPSLKSHGFSLIEELKRNKLKSSMTSRDSKLIEGSRKGTDSTRSKRKDRSSPHSKTKIESKADKLKSDSTKRRSLEKRKDVHGSTRAKRSRSASHRKEGDKSRRRISRSRSKGTEKKADKTKFTDNIPKNSSAAKPSVKDEGKLAEKSRAQTADKAKGEDKSFRVNEEKMKSTTGETQSKVKLSKDQKVRDCDKVVTNLKKPSVSAAKTAKKKDERKKSSKKSKERKKLGKKQKKKSHSSKSSDRKKKHKRDKKHKHTSNHRRHKATPSDSSTNDTSSESSNDSTEETDSSTS